MEQSGWGDATGQGRVLSLDPHVSGITLWVGAPGEALLTLAEGLKDAGRRFVVVARSLPSAVRIAQGLCPEEADLLARAAQAEKGPPPVALFRGHARPAERRALIEHHRDGATLGLVLTPDDLDSYHVVQELSSSEGALWLVEDAHRMSVFSPGYAPSLRSLARVDGAAGHVLFTDLDDAQILADLGRLLDFGPEAVAYGGGELPSSVAIEVDHEPGVMASRDALRACLRRHIPAEGHSRALVVAPLQEGAGQSGGMPTSELISVAEELGLHPLRDPGEDADAKTSTWRNILRQDDILLLSDDAEALGILPGGDAPIYVRLIPPEAPEVILQEVRALARSGGGKWVFAGGPAGELSSPLTSEVVGQALTKLLEGVEGDGPASFDLLSSLEPTQMGWDGPPAAFANALADALQDLAGLGLVADVRDVKLNLEVAEAGRLRPPFIAGDVRYQSLVDAYDRALKALPLAESVRFRLAAREPHDMSVLAGRLGYSVAALGGLFDDLGRDGIVVCQQGVKGPRGTRNLEITPGRPWQGVLEGLGQSLRALDALWERRRGWRNAVNAVVTAEDARGAFERALGAELESIPLPVASVAVFTTPAPQADELVEEAPGGVDIGALTGSDLQATRPPPAPAPPEAPAAAPEGPSLAERVDALAEDASVEEIAALALEVAASSSKAELLVQLAAGSPAHGATAALVRTADWDAEAGVVSLQSVLEDGAPLPVAGLIARVEFHPQTFDGVPISHIPPAVEALALRLPLVESLTGNAALEALERMAQLASPDIPLRVEAAELGSVRVHLPDGEGIYLERRGGAPEVEALLWLAAQGRGGDELPPGLCIARLAEALMAIAGVGDEALTARLAAAIADHTPPPAELSDGRWRFAVARALVATGRHGDAFNQLAELTLPDALAADHLRALADAAIESGRGAEALEWAASDERAPGVFGSMVTALEQGLAARGRGDELGRLEAAYHPAPEAFWAFIGANPFGSPLETLQQRIEAQSQAGLPPLPIEILKSLMEGDAAYWPVDLLGEMFPGVVGAKASDWAALADRLLRVERPTVARLAFAQGGDPGEDADANLVAVRLSLAEGDIPTALTHAARVEAAAVARAMRHTLGESWLDQLSAAVEGGQLDDGQRAIAEGLIAEARRREELNEARGRVQQALGAGRWDEVITATRALEAAVGEGGRDRILAATHRRLREREAHLRGRLRDMSRWPAGRRRPQDVERLARSAEAMGLTDLAAAVRALAVDGGPPEQGARRRAAPEHRSQGRAGGDRRERGGVERRAGGPRPLSAASVLDGPVEELPARLKAASEAAGHDRVRANLVSGVLKKTMASHPEAALKGLKACLPTFQRVEVLDGPLGRLVRAGSPADDHLPRLRRLLGPVEARFRSTFEALSSRENPEPWKQILGQLKISK